MGKIEKNTIFLHQLNNFQTLFGNPFTVTNAKVRTGTPSQESSTNDRADQRPSKDVTVHLKLAAAKAEKHDFNGAIAEFDRALQFDPNNGLIYSDRGAVKHRKNDLRGALADFDRAIALNPSDAITYRYRGSLKYERNHFAGAIADLGRALQLNPKDANAYVLRGLAKADNVAVTLIFSVQKGVGDDRQEKEN